MVSWKVHGIVGALPAGLLVYFLPDSFNSSHNPISIVLLSFSVAFFVGSFFPDILEPYSLSKKMHRGKHHSMQRLNFLKEILVKYSFILIALIIIVFVLNLLISINDVLPFALLIFGLFNGFCSGYIIHLLLDKTHPLGLPKK